MGNLEFIPATRASLIFLLQCAWHNNGHPLVCHPMSQYDHCTSRLTSTSQTCRKHKGEREKCHAHYQGNIFFLWKLNFCLIWQSGINSHVWGGGGRKNVNVSTPGSLCESIFPRNGCIDKKGIMETSIDTIVWKGKFSGSPHLEKEL